MTKRRVSQKKTTKKTTKRARPVRKVAPETARTLVHVPSGDFDGMWYPGDNTNRGRLYNGQIVFLFENKKDTYTPYLHIDPNDGFYITVRKEDINDICNCPLLHIRLMETVGPDQLRHWAAQMAEWADDLEAPDIWNRG